MSYQAVCNQGDYVLYGYGEIGTFCYAARHAIQFNHVVDVLDGETGQMRTIDGRLKETTDQPPF